MILIKILRSKIKVVEKIRRVIAYSKRRITTSILCSPNLINTLVKNMINKTVFYILFTNIHNRKSGCDIFTENKRQHDR
jgi:hypothetical protein